MNIRNAAPDDAARICEIYNYYVEHTPVSFETVAVSEDAMRRRIADVLRAGDPYCVVEIDNRVAGYCYLREWNSRGAYVATKTVAVYVDKNSLGKGLGSALYTHLFRHIHERDDIHAVIAGISLPNDNSVRLHEKFGFRQVSHMPEIGTKFGEWRDVGHWLYIVKTSKSPVCDSIL